MEAFSSDSTSTSVNFSGSMALCLQMDRRCAQIEHKSRFLKTDACPVSQTIHCFLLKYRYLSSQGACRSMPCALLSYEFLIDAINLLSVFGFQSEHTSPIDCQRLCDFGTYSYNGQDNLDPATGLSTGSCRPCNNGSFSSRAGSRQCQGCQQVESLSLAFPTLVSKHGIWPDFLRWPGIRDRVNTLPEILRIHNVLTVPLGSRGNHLTLSYHGKRYWSWMHGIF